MRIATLSLSSTLVAGLFAGVAHGATPPTVAPAVVHAPGTVELRFPITGIAGDAFTTVTPDSIYLPANAYHGRISSVNITGTRIEGGGKLTPTGTVANEFVGCIRGGVFPIDRRTYRLDVPANTTVTVVVTAKVPRGLPGEAAGVTLSHGALQTSDGAATGQPLVETAPIRRTGSVDALSLKASQPSKSDKVTFTGRLIPARRGAAITLVSRVAQPFNGPMRPVPFGDPLSAFGPRKELTKLGSTRTTQGGRYRVTLKVPANVGVAARTAGVHAGSSCGVLGQLMAVPR